MAERVVRRQRIPLLALDQAIAQERAADGLHVHRILRLHVEHIALAILAAQRVGVATGVDVQGLGARGDLRDSQARGGRNLADDAGDFVALDQALRLGRGGLGLTESSFKSSTLRPIMPPAALISSTARSAAITAYSPSGPRKPVRGVR